MPDFSEKPDAGMIDAAVKYFQGVWAATHDKWADIDRFHQGTFDVWTTPEHLKQRASYHPSTANNRVNHAVDTLLSFSPAISREPVSNTDANKASADELEVAAKAVLQDSYAQEMVIPPKYTGGNLVQYGYTPVEAPILDSRMMRAGRNGSRNWNPVRTRVLPPNAVLMDPSETVPTIAIKVMKRTVADLQQLSIRKAQTRVDARRFKDVAGDLGPYEEVEVVEWWSETWHALKPKDWTDKVLYVEKNVWGFVPFRHTFSGWGRMPTNAAGFDPQHLAVGILDAVREGIRLKAQRMSGHHTVLMNNTYPFMITSQDPLDIAAQMRAGGILQGAKEDFGLMDSQEISAAMFQIGQDVDDDIELGTMTNTLAGFRQTGVSTVGQQQLLTTAAQRKFAAVANQNETLWSGVLSNILRMVDKLTSLEAGISASGKTIRRTAIDGDYDIGVKFETIDPQLDIQRREIGMREVEQGLISDQTYRQERRISDETLERDRIDTERLLKNPFMVAVRARRIAEREGVEADLEEAERLQAETAQDGRANPNPEETDNTGVTQDTGTFLGAQNPESVNFGG
jgi:hypothetical protein